MPMKTSAIQVADDLALDHRCTVDAVLADGVVTPREADLLRRQSREVSARVHRAHGAQRAAVSMLRYEEVNVQVHRDFGAQPDDKLRIAR